VLRDDALEAQLAGVLEDGRPVAVDVLVELDPGACGLTQEMLEPPPALLQWLDPQVNAAQIQQVKGAEKDRPVRSLVSGSNSGMVPCLRAVQVGPGPNAHPTEQLGPDLLETVRASDASGGDWLRRLITCGTRLSSLIYWIVALCPALLFLVSLGRERFLR
jgi:hypothetical protein